MECPVMKVKCSNESGYKVINVDDFDETVHEEFVQVELEPVQPVQVELEPVQSELVQSELKPAWLPKKPK